MWNDQGEVLLGSANIDRWALRTNFECCLHLHNVDLARQLSQACQADAVYCLPGGRMRRGWALGDSNTAVTSS